MRAPSLLVVLSLVVVGLGLLPLPVSALQFEPTDDEWARWPEYCRARYVVSGKGRNSGRETEMSKNAVAAWQSRIGTDAWHGLHHHCAALAYLQRGIQMKPGVVRENMMEAAVRNHGYALKTLPPSHFLYPDVMTSLATAYATWGKAPMAQETLDTVIKAQPGAPLPYLVRARIARDAGRASAAREALLEGDRATGGLSPDIKYALGVDYFKADEYSQAQVYAREAYGLGYPMPWLRDQLRRKGLSVDPLRNPTDP